MLSRLKYFVSIALRSSYPNSAQFRLRCPLQGRERFKKVKERTGKTKARKKE